MTRFVLWRPSAMFWRVCTLVLAVLPQGLDTSVPDLVADDVEPFEGDVMIAQTVLLSSPPWPEQWLEYLTESGLAVLVPAVALVLPVKYARIGTRWAALLLAALGVADGYLGLSALQSSTGGGESSVLLFMSPFYVLAAVTLVVSERVNRPAPSQPEPS
ncbi:hypothetical protein [Nocardia blacklockiae]|uniref:hypothetical protein n=1 Tax=Nocardia blacklockiae TaxID=480036 RepID=UPI0018942B96|nr:hypothetical protein [Nocardia blacklockiae]MBF6172295.1 hypothetical protein [Nocardia blacklockiae]